MERTTYDIKRKLKTTTKYTQYNRRYRTTCWANSVKLYTLPVSYVTRVTWVCRWDRQVSNTVNFLLFCVYIMYKQLSQTIYSPNIPPVFKITHLEINQKQPLIQPILHYIPPKNVFFALFLKFLYLCALFQSIIQPIPQIHPTDWYTLLCGMNTMFFDVKFSSQIVTSLPVTKHFLNMPRSNLFLALNIISAVLNLTRSQTSMWL